MLPASDPAATEAIHEELYLVAGYLRGLLDYVRARGAEVAPVLAAMDLTEDRLRDPDCLIRHALQDDAFEAAERVTGDTNVGLHAGEVNHLIHFGIIGQLALTCTTGAELLDLQLRYRRLIGNAVGWDQERQGEHLILRLHTARRSPRMRHALEYTLAAQLTLARLLAGGAFSPTHIELDYEEPPESGEQRRVFGCPAAYSCAATRIFLPAGVLELPLAMGTSVHRPALESEARRRLEALRVPMSHGDPEVARVKQYVADRLSTGAPSIDEVAAALRVSSRTLQRRLEEQGLPYRDVVDVTRREIAERLIADSSLTLLDVALLLGFSEQSALSRAFRRWFSTTPSEYREKRIAETG